MTGRIVMGSDSRRVEWTVADLLKENQKKVILDMADVTIGTVPAWVS
jgi:hypothetical protein